jgi:hypothetical protein
VNKIFILSHHEVKSRLSEFIHPDDFPKKYGGNLDWDFGMTPQLDEVARTAMEKNGSKGWIEGPCLWEQDQRVPVGTVNGKSRRPDKMESAPTPAKIDGQVAQHLPTAHTATTAAIPAIVPATDPGTIQPRLAETSNPPSMAHSGSTAATSVETPPEITNALTVNGTTKVLDSEAPLVANGEVLHARDVKPPMERFVTAIEDLTTTRPQVNGVA